MPTYAELHSHTNFSFLHGASPVEDMAERAAQLGLAGLAVTDHDGLYGVVRFTTAAQAVGWASSAATAPVNGLNSPAGIAGIVSGCGYRCATRRKPATTL